MAFPDNTPALKVILDQNPAPVDEQDFQRWMLYFLNAINTAAGGGATTPMPYGAAGTQVMSTALEASHILKASAGKLHALTVFNSKASAQFILIMDSATLPVDGAVTLLYPPIPIAAATTLVLDLPHPITAAAGIVVCNSSTGTFSKTIGSADCAFWAQVTA